MALSRKERVQWTLEKASEYLASANDNLQARRLFPAAEDIFRAVETALEALLYTYGVRAIEFPGRRDKFTGRLALQFLVRDTLVAPGRIEEDVYQQYLNLATGLHGGGYTPVRSSMPRSCTATPCSRRDSSPVRGRQRRNFFEPPGWPDAEDCHFRALPATLRGRARRLRTQRHLSTGAGLPR